MDATSFDTSQLPSRPGTAGRFCVQPLENVKLDTNHRVVYPVSNPICGLGGVVGRNGASAPEGAIVQVADMSKLEFRGPTRHIDRDEDAFAANACGTSIDGVARLAPSEPYQSHVLCTNAGQVAAAVNGAVRHPAGKADVVS